MGQRILSGPGWQKSLAEELAGQKKLLLVCGVSFGRLSIREDIEALPVDLARFSGFSSNPKYEEVCEGIKLFRAERCDGILAIGGGSAMDVAKCIKLYSQMDPARNYLEQIPRGSEVPLIAVPTTAGTGSESTHFAVIYYQGVKQSVAHESILPDWAVLEPAVLEGLPLYQKKCTMLDALCQGIESWWSVNSTEESIGFARQAVETIRDNWRAYIVDGDPSAAAEIMCASNCAGRAINITQTTAPHAMSYKLTSLYGLPHGHAVAVCLPEVWAYMLAHMENCIDRRGAVYLQEGFASIAHALGYTAPEEAVSGLRHLLSELDIGYPVSGEREQQLDMLAASVNPVRLKNNPVYLDMKALRGIYSMTVIKEPANKKSSPK